MKLASNVKGAHSERPLVEGQYLSKLRMTDGQGLVKGWFDPSSLYSSFLSSVSS